jgi:hypothetical protein
VAELQRSIGGTKQREQGAKHIHFPETAQDGTANKLQEYLLRDLDLLPVTSVA